jgi:hypothetical protein
VSTFHSHAAAPSIRVPLKTAAGLAVNGLVVTGQTADFDTLAVAPKGAIRVGLFVNVSAEDSASGTIDIDIEQSLDKGTTWIDMPQSANSQTGADVTQITATGTSYIWWEHCGDLEFSRIRGEFDIDCGTDSDTMTFGPSYWVFSNVN